MTGTMRTLMVCDCEGTMALDGTALAKACGKADPLRVATQLCGKQADRVATAAAQGPLLIACTAEQGALADAAGDGADLAFVNIRETAGWSAQGAAAWPKMAALIAAAEVPLAPTAVVPLKSDGVALIYGRDEVAIEAAKRLSGKLDVTVLLKDPRDVLPPRGVDFPVLKGLIRSAKGYLGAFEIVVDDYAQPNPSSRARLEFGVSRMGANSRCDIIIDLSGGAPLFPAGHTRDGYLRADPGNAGEVARILFDAADLVGEFDKPRYVDYTPDLCAHSRSKKTGCTRCLDVCPTGAITSAGDHVAIDPYICGGCGACHAVCPTGAASYALPTADQLLERVRTLLTSYRDAGGAAPVLLIHDAAHGAPLIDLLARLGDGLPARVLPMEVNEITQLGIEVFSTALALGAAEIRILAPRKPKDGMDGLAGVLGLMETVATGLGYGTGRTSLIEVDDPDALAQALSGLPSRDGTATPKPFLPLGDKRGLMKLSLRQMQKAAPAPVDVLPLSAGAPFGAVDINTDGCTLCLACVSACPTGALSDDQDRPRLSFTEDACVQCGLCKVTCPEKVITLAPRLNFTDAALSPTVVKEEEPACCIRCGKAFGVKSTVEKIVAKLSDKHWMYLPGGAGANPVDRIRMCADCRVISASSTGLDPYAGSARPKPRTGDDYS